MKILSFSALCASLLLSGCATTWQVDSEVQTFSSLPAVPPTGVAAPAPATTGFRFDRLPLQQATPAQQAGQARLEAMALPALNQVGLVQDEARARYNVQVSAQLQQVLPDFWDGPRPLWWPRNFSASVSYGRGGFGPPGFYGYGMYPGLDERQYQREVSVILRDAATGQVVYETRATNLGRWPVDGDVLPLMFSAALSGYPTPPAGLRRVNVSVPR